MFRAISSHTHVFSGITRSITTELMRPGMKHKIPQKRYFYYTLYIPNHFQNIASKLLNELKEEELDTLKNGREFPRFRAGDSIEIEKLPYMSATTPDIIKGVVIAKCNRASDSNITLLNVEYGTPIKRRIAIYSPLIKSIKILQEAFIHEGKKAVRRSKLYYLMDRHPDTFTVR